MDPNDGINNELPAEGSGQVTAEAVAPAEPEVTTEVTEEPKVEAAPEVSEEPEVAQNAVTALSDEDVYQAIKQQVADKGDATVPEGATAHQYIVQLVRWAREVGKIEDDGISPESDRLAALEARVKAIVERLAYHGMPLAE